METWAIVVAAGKGRRTGLHYNKVFHPLNGRSVLSRSVETLFESASIDGIVLVLAEDDFERFEALSKEEPILSSIDRVVVGGATRQESVMNGLLALPESAGIVAVHDAARPFTPPSLVSAAVESARQFGSGVAATKVTDTVKITDGRGYALETPDRATLRAAQTPQVFGKEALLLAYRKACADGFSATDDAQVMEKYDGPVRLVEEEGASRNIKITAPEDLAMPEALRIGYGHDAHRFAEDRKLVLCGVEVPYELGLLGHSDADVAVHALMDALLGAACLGDIGRHFPDDDPEYEGISSMALLTRVMDAIKNAGFVVQNADITIIAQKPKLAPFMDQMRDGLAALMGCAVNVKATTTEKMGFTGRMEGISASAVALIRGGGIK